MTNGILETVQDWTGARPPTCPWRAFYDPRVARVVRAYDAWNEGGQADYGVPRPSHWFVEAYAYFNRCVRSIFSQQRKMDREEVERARRAAAHG